jgi:hypothetical protein
VVSLAGRVDVVVSAGACAVVVGCCVVSCCCCVVVVVGWAWLVVERVVVVLAGAALVVSALLELPLPPEVPLPLVVELTGVKASPMSKVGAFMVDRSGRAGWRCERCASQCKRKKCGLES